MATIAQLPFADASFDAVLTMFSSLGYLERDEDVSVLRELRRVLRPGRTLIVETAHRDAFARSARSLAHAPGTGFRTARSTSRSARPTGRPEPSARTE